jgi:hypothetical protein
MDKTAMLVFTIVTGVASLLGFILQIKDIFPKYRRYYTAATFILFGVTIGFGLNTLTGTTIQLPASLSPRNLIGILLFGGAGVLIFFCFTAAALIGNPERRSELSRIGSAVSGFLIFLLMFFINTFFPPTEPPKSPVFTYDEHVECAINAAKLKNFDRSLVILDSAISDLGIGIGDSRRDTLDELKTQIRGQQADAATNQLKTSVLPTVK